MDFEQKKLEITVDELDSKIKFLEKMNKLQDDMFVHETTRHQQAKANNDKVIADLMNAKENTEKALEAHVALKIEKVATPVEIKSNVSN